MMLSLFLLAWRTVCNWAAHSNLELFVTATMGRLHLQFCVCLIVYLALNIVPKINHLRFPLALVFHWFLGHVVLWLLCRYYSKDESLNGMDFHDCMLEQCKSFLERLGVTTDLVISSSSRDQKLLGPCCGLVLVKDERLPRNPGYLGCIIIFYNKKLLKKDTIELLVSNPGYWTSRSLTCWMLLGIWRKAIACCYQPIVGLLVVSSSTKSKKQQQ